MNLRPALVVSPLPELDEREKSELPLKLITDIRKGRKCTDPWIDIEIARIIERLWEQIEAQLQRQEEIPSARLGTQLVPIVGRIAVHTDLVLDFELHTSFAEKRGVLDAALARVCGKAHQPLSLEHLPDGPVFAVQANPRKAGPAEFRLGRIEPIKPKDELIAEDIVRALRELRGRNGQKTPSHVLWSIEGGPHPGRVYPVLLNSRAETVHPDAGKLFMMRGGAAATRSRSLADLAQEILGDDRL